jgi:hypothetical protein
MTLRLDLWWRRVRCSLFGHRAQAGYAGYGNWSYCRRCWRSL